MRKQCIQVACTEWACNVQMSGSLFISLVLVLGLGVQMLSLFSNPGVGKYIYQRRQIINIYCVISWELGFFLHFSLGNLVTQQGSPRLGCLHGPGRHS